MDVHLVDGTYELFRHFFAVPSTVDSNGQEIAAVRGVLSSVLSMIERGATHIGVALIISSNRFETICIPDTRQARACRRSCSRSSLFSRKPLNQWGRGLADGRLMRPMMRSPLQSHKAARDDV